MRNIYYVYAYLRKSDLSPYYIGKGCNKRAYDTTHSVSLPSNKKLIVFLETNLSELGALALERRYIRWYGRKDLGTGILHNKTDGGDMPPDVTGIKRSDETKMKLSMAWKNRKPLSDAARENIRLAALARPKPSKEAIEKRVKAMAGKKRAPCSDERKRKIGEANTGKRRTPAQVEAARQRRAMIKNY